MKLDTLLKNGKVVIPRSGVIQADIGIHDGKIVGIYENGEQVEAFKVLDVSGKYIFPGLVDAHEHLGIYQPLDVDFGDTYQHAIGGVTTVVNFDRRPQSYHEIMPGWIETGEANSYIDFAYSLGILTEQHIEELDTYVEKYGVTSFKFFRNYERQLNDKFKIDNGIDLSGMDLIRILKRLKEISPDLLLCIHCENMDINRYLTKELKSQDVEDSLATWSKTSPGFAEAESLLSTVYLNHIAEGNVFLVHLSSGASVEVLDKINWLTQRGVKVETCPHYLVLNEESPANLQAKVGPPIHTSWDSERLWDGLKKGTINAIGTDHVPSNKDTKFKSGTCVWDTMYGFPGVGALLPLMLTEGHVKRGISLERIAELTSLSVAESFHLPQKGRIEIGADADFAIVDLEKEKVISHEMFHSFCDYSVYEGIKAVGWPEYTISRGQVIVEDGKPVSNKGRGKFIFRSV